MNNKDQHDTYIIPPNFIEGGTIFGGMFKIRNVIEAGILATIIGVPVFSIGLSITARIIIFCLTALPLAILALFGVSGESLSSFVIAFFKWVKNRRVIGKRKEIDDVSKTENNTVAENKMKPPFDKLLSVITDVINKIISKSSNSQKKMKPKKHFVKENNNTAQEKDSKFLNPVAEYLPIEKIENGIIYTKDHRYVKIIEVTPVNFLLRSAREQRSIIYSFISYLKISPVKIQFKVLTKGADLNKHTDIVRREMENEEDPNCRALQEDYLQLINKIGSKEATTRRFFIAFEYEQVGRRNVNDETDAISSLQTAARTAANYLKQCGNDVIIPDNEDEFKQEAKFNAVAV